MKNNIKEKTITEDVVRYVARLSRLSLDDTDVTRFRGQLSRILDYIAQLNEVNTEGTLPTTHVLSSMKNVFREDEQKASLSPEEALANAPARKENFFKVPRII
ncbi:MAG: Asp-tRNA(Asn)/Glu-tRNA(Gln) amidotransferase subunit GatB [Candidatus Makaraimicrobium thalassicum]|nr:MAG: Asp-tRNA(Asn)/Glu-tRNA(Gln) amidotransferase subunit GatB [Candidatus Omnitrophota bacterium]